jgi:hypothetical protein
MGNFPLAAISAICPAAFDRGITNDAIKYSMRSS